MLNNQRVITPPSSAAVYGRQGSIQQPEESPATMFGDDLFNHPMAISCNVGKTIINHPPVITISKWYEPFPNGWFISFSTLILGIVYSWASGLPQKSQFPATYDPY